MQTAEKRDGTLHGGLGFALVCIVAGALAALAVASLFLAEQEDRVHTPVIDRAAPQVFVDLNADHAPMFFERGQRPMIDFSPRPPLFARD